jgi:hypothetical protein
VWAMSHLLLALEEKGVSMKRQLDLKEVKNDKCWSSTTSSPGASCRGSRIYSSRYAEETD